MSFFAEIFSYQKGEPLLFTQLFFWAFFAVVLTFYSFFYKQIRARNAYLFLISLFFYYKTSGIYVLLLLFSTFVDFSLGLAIGKSERKWKRILFVSASIGVNLFVLFYYKYSYFIASSLNDWFGLNINVIDFLAYQVNQVAGTTFDIDTILLPVGISFFTFQSISYTVEVYRKQIEPVNNLLDFGFYVSFFPQLVAGPIVRATEFIPQIYKPYQLSKQEFGIAIFMIINGLLKKMFISDYISINFVDRVFSNPGTYGGFENLMALYGYSIQVYCDFSGYTDIATGVALLLGFRLPQNFNSPYKALHVGDFWKRWHMSLSTWLKNYLYFPLGGNKKGEFRTNVNLMITMLLGGLWHGASWQFVIWGGLNGIGLVFYKYWKRISPFKNDNKWLVRFYAIFITFNFITFTRIWFRSQTMEGANTMLYQIAYAFDVQKITEMMLAYKNIFAVIVFAYIIHWLPVTLKDRYKNWFVSSSIWLKFLIVITIVFIIFQVKSSELQPFIYFQF